MADTAPAPSDSEPEPSDEEHTEDDLTEEESHGNDGVKGKKKKRKKKKKKPQADGAAGPGAGSDEGAAAKSTVADKHEAERRFHQAVESAKQGEDMWVLLANANVHGAKARKLFEALKSNSTVISVNLSCNNIGDDGVQALVDVLQDGGCSELINLDLRGNELSPHAEQLLSELQKKRRQLVIETGPLSVDKPPAEQEQGGKHGGGKAGRGRVAAARAAAAASRSAAAGQPQQHHGGEQLEGQSLRDLVKHSAMFRRYFQTEGEEEGGGAGSSSGGEEEQLNELPSPEEVWGQVSALLPGGVPAIPGVSEALVAVSRALDAEMAAMPAAEDNAALDDLRPHFRAVVQHMGLLQQVLQLEPEPQLNQSSSGVPQPAVGSHRMWACAILHMVLLHNHPAIDRAVADAGVLPAAVALALQHERCSAVQCRTVEMLRAALQSSVPELWQRLLEPGYGCGIQWQQGGSGGALIPPLHESVLQLAAAAVKQPMGRRPCLVGFVAELANALLQGADPSNSDPHCRPLVDVLAGCEEWQCSAAPGGAIHRLLQEQEGQLCGPPPPRPAPSADEEDEEGAEQAMAINGTQLMALLSRMGELSGT